MREEDVSAAHGPSWKFTLARFGKYYNELGVQRHLTVSPKQRRILLAEGNAGRYDIHQ